MATAAEGITRRFTGRRAPRPLAADGYERFLAAASLLLLAVVLVALARGRAEWGRVPPAAWAHLLSAVAALALTPVVLLGRRGDRRHRWLGRVWVLAMLGTAAASLGVQAAHPGHFSFVHLVSLYVLAAAPAAWWAARTHRVALHRRMVRGIVTGALLVAGSFTFTTGRLMGHWLLG